MESLQIFTMGRLQHCLVIMVLVKLQPCQFSQVRRSTVFICHILLSGITCWVVHAAVSRIMNSFTQTEVLVDMQGKLFSATLLFACEIRSFGAVTVNLCSLVVYVQMFQRNLLSHSPEHRASRYHETSVNFYRRHCSSQSLPSYPQNSHGCRTLTHIIHGHWRLYRLKSGMLFQKSWMLSLM